MTQKLGATTNELLLSLVAGSIHHYYKEHGERPQNLRVIMPVSNRPLAARRQLGNYLTGVGLKLPIDCKDPRRRVTALQEELANMKKRGSFGAYALLGGFSSLLPRKLQRIVCEAQARKACAICTNMISYKNYRYIAGARVESNHAVAALMRNHGLGFSFLSYARKVFVSILVDPEIIPNSDSIHRCFEYSARELAQATDFPKKRKRSLILT